MLNKNTLKNYCLYILLTLPFIILYMSLFSLSMETALDRGAYLRVMEAGYTSNRIEPLLPLISNALEYFISNNTIKLLSLQFIFISLLLQSLYLYFKPNSVQPFSKSIIALLLFIAIYSNPLGVQLRIGYASLIFLYFIINIKAPRPLIHLPYFVIPILMHYGTAFGILFYWYINIFKINSFRRFVWHSLFILGGLTVVILNIDRIFSILGLSAYYYSYLDEEESFGRELPYSALLYIVTCFYNILYSKNKDHLFYFSLSGLWLVYIGLILDFYLAFKMLIPISMYALLYTVKSLPIEKKPYIHVLLAYLLMPIVFYYYASITDII